MKILISLWLFHLLSSSIHQFQDYTIKHLNLRTKYQETSNRVPSQQASSQLPKAILQINF
jgi:hypothetical protein